MLFLQKIQSIFLKFPPNWSKNLNQLAFDHLRMCIRISIWDKHHMCGFEDMEFKLEFPTYNNVIRWLHWSNMNFTSNHIKSVPNENRKMWKDDETFIRKVESCWQMFPHPSVPDAVVYFTPMDDTCNTL